MKKILLLLLTSFLVFSCSDKGDDIGRVDEEEPLELTTADRVRINRENLVGHWGVSRGYPGTSERYYFRDNFTLVKYWVEYKLAEEKYYWTKQDEPLVEVEYRITGKSTYRLNDGTKVIFKREYDSLVLTFEDGKSTAFQLVYFSDVPADFPYRNEGLEEY